MQHAYEYLSIYICICDIAMSDTASCHQDGRIGIPLTHLTQPHFNACPKSGPGFPYHMLWSFF
jgi:hypothetical protein